MTAYTTLSFNDDQLSYIHCVLTSTLVNFIYRKYSLKEAGTNDPYGVHIESDMRNALKDKDMNVGVRRK